jgi:uncharacterized OsmC-like protein
MKFHLIATVTISVHTDVEADTLEKAIEIAEERSLCTVGDPGMYGASSEHEWCHSGELDGTVEDIHLEGV